MISSERIIIWTTIIIHPCLCESYHIKCGIGITEKVSKMFKIFLNTPNVKIYYTNFRLLRPVTAYIGNIFTSIFKNTIFIWVKSVQVSRFVVCFINFIKNVFFTESLDINSLPIMAVI